MSPRADTRALLIDEGVRALGDLTPRALMSAVGVKEVARRAGVGVTTLYHHFGTLDAFADAVVAHVYDVERFPVASITDLVEQIVSSPFPAEVGMQLHRAEFARLTNDPELRVRLGLWAFGTAEVDATYAAFLRQVDAQLTAFTEKLFEAWNREIQPPLDMQAYVAAHVAFLSGASVRHSVDPGLLDAERFARAASCLTTMMHRVKGDTRTLDDRLAETNYFPIQAAAARAVTEQRRETRTRILDAAAELFRRHGLDAVTMPRIAAQAGIGNSTAYALFRNTADVAVALLAARAAEALREPGAPDPPEPAAGLQARLLRVAVFLAASADHVQPYGTRLLTGELPADADPVLGEVRDALAVARTAGAVRDGADLDRAARAIVLSLISSLLARAAAGPEGAVADVGALLLPALLAE